MQRFTLACLAWTLWLPMVRGAESVTAADVSAGLHKATDFFRKQVSIEGGYLWTYSADLSQREGEGRASPTTAWVQPPGTPAVGEAFLVAYTATADPYYLQAASETALALVRGQLRSGGWDYRIEFADPARARYAYRVEAPRDSQRNESTLDDNTTQAALRFLMHVDRALKFQETRIHEAATYALESLEKAQYPNGAWPQRYTKYPDPAKFPARKVSYPATWPREFPQKTYSAFYTFNDGALCDVISTLVEAAEIYQEPRWQALAEKGGEFILAAQMPDPQPAWAQQYDADMHPAWARKFEPPAVTGGESQGILRTLLFLYRKTGNRRYLEPLPRALAYLRQSQVAPNRCARFYELQTNKPLYFTKDYVLTYSNNDVPTHYAFVVEARLDAIQAEYERLLQLPPEQRDPPVSRSAPRLTSGLASQARDVLRRMDDRGAWVVDGTLRTAEPPSAVTQIIDCQTFIKNVEILSRFLLAARATEEVKPR
jgi:PelA/Pel-15E family pectate lyase